MDAELNQDELSVLTFDGDLPCLPPDQLLIELQSRANNGDSDAASLLDLLNGDW